ncbi:MAG TPA: AMP-binding protein [Pirellulaceae bacterium]
MLLQAPTIIDLFSRRIDADGPKPALGIKRGGKYQWLTWNDVATDVRRLASALAGLGTEPGERIAHISENRYEWILTDLAIQLVRAVHVPIQPTLAGPQIAWQLRHCGCRTVLFSGPHQAAKLIELSLPLPLGEGRGEGLAIRQSEATATVLPPGIQFFTYDDCDHGARPRGALTDQLPANPAPSLKITPFATLLERGNPADGLRLEKIALEQTTPSSLTTILYTSGTTGEPKGVMLTQGNLANNSCQTIEASGYIPDLLRLNFLPLSHIFARTCDLYCWLVEGSRLALAESRETVLADCRAVHPQSLNGVPYFYDKVYRKLCAEGKQNTPGALLAELGGAIERCCAGGAALPDYLHDYFHAQGVLLLQGYGLSESSPVISLSTPDHHRRGSCGRPIPGIEVKIAADGEILTRGPHVMPGYYKNEQATHDVIHDGWLATGDIGRQDADGFLYITGRKKEILVTLGGKNIAPVYLESLLTEDPLILQAMIIGDGKPYLSALIVPNFDTLKIEQQKLGLSDPSLKDLPLKEALTHAKIISLYRSHINDRLQNVSPHEQVGQFCLLDQPFTIESGLLTPKLSLRRQQISHHYSTEIAALYNIKKC